MVYAFEKVSRRKILYQIVEPRPSDIGVCYANSTKSTKELGWVAFRGIEEICKGTWRWQSNNPNGYDERANILTVKM